VDDKLRLIYLQARAAMVLSFFDPEQSNDIFVTIWTLAKQQTDKQFDKDQAFNIILKFLFPRNPRLAKQLLAEKNKQSDEAAKQATQLDNSLANRFKLASELMEVDPALASSMLEQALSGGVTPFGVNALNKLNDKDPFLAQFVAAKALEGLRSQPTAVSLNGLHLLSAFIFPEGSAPGVDSALQSLQFRYFATTYDVLKSSLKESAEVLVRENRYNESDLRLRTIFQAQVASILAALAPRFQPGSVAELNELASKLSPNIPGNIAPLVQFNAARLSGNTPPNNPELALPLAIASGDFDEANRIIESVKDDDAKSRYRQLLAKMRARALLASGDVIGALTYIRSIEDRNARVGYYLSAIATAQKKHNSDVSNILIHEARTAVPQVDRNGLDARLLLSLALLVSQTSPAEAEEFVQTAISAINSLTRKETPATVGSGAELALNSLNDPRSFLNAQEFDGAFLSFGALDLNHALIAARTIDLKSLQLNARLGALEGYARNEWKKPNSKNALSVPSSKH